MILKTLVKINTVTHLSDARYASAMGVDFLGFNIHPEDFHSQNYISPQKFTEITSWVAGVSFVGEIYKPLSKNIWKDNWFQEYILDFLETDDVELIPFLQTTNIPLILKLPLEKLWELKFFPSIKYVIISEQIEDKDALKKYAKQCPYKILLSENFSDTMMTECIEEKQVSGICLNSGSEEKIGYRNYDSLAKILEKITIE